MTNSVVSAQVEYPVMEVIRNRKSRRAFLDKAVEIDKINSLFEAARWSASAVNEQPWSYLYATKDQPELWSKLHEVLNEGNKIWTAKAPVLILSMFRKTLSFNGKPNGSARYDLGGANAFLSLQGTELGLNVHQMGGYDHVKAREILNIPDELDLGVMIAVGYPGDPEILPETLKQRELAPRQRFVQKEFVMNKSF